MTKEEQFIAALKGNVIKDDDGFHPVIQAVVTEVMESTCTVKLVSNDLELSDVLFSATEDNDKGFVLIPKKDTNVLVGLIGSDENSLYLVRVDEVEKVSLKIDTTKLTIDKDGTIYNDGTNGGMVISEKVTDEINALKADINSLKQALTTWLPAPNDGGAGLKAAAASWAGQTLIDTVKIVLENDKITH